MPNGRLVLDLTNLNKAVLEHNKFKVFNKTPFFIKLFPGHANIQLVGPPLHGGPTWVN